MPTRDEHIRKAKHNESFISSFDLNSTPFLDWVVTAIFYAALHYLDAYLAENNKHPGTHQVRNSLFSKDPNLATLWNSYQDLENDSREARYHMKEFTPHRCELRFFLISIQ